MKFFQNLFILAISISTVPVSFGKTYTYTARPTCSCTCPFNKFTVCETVRELKSVADANTEQLIIWAKYRQFVQHFSENWREEIADIVETIIKDYIWKGKFRQGPENLIEKVEDGMQNDSAMTVKPVEDDIELLKNVSSLREKVEIVENRTKEVEEELKTERRVRRDLEEKVNKTHTSIVLIEDQLHNVSIPMDAMLTQVEMKLYASIEDLNKTIYEDHLKNLYYKVDGVAYKNETKKLDERIDHVEVELHDSGNSSVVSRLAEDLKTLEENVYMLNNSIGDVFVPRLQSLNNSIGQILIPRLEMLETETVRKHAVEKLEDKMLNLLNDTEMLKLALVEILSGVQSVQNLEEQFQNFSGALTKSLEVMQMQIEILKNESHVDKLTETPDGVVDAVQNFNRNSSSISQEKEMLGYIADEPTTELHTTDTNDIETTAAELTANEILVITEDLATTTPKVTDRSRIDGVLDYDGYIPCDAPSIDDPHLLLDVVRNNKGQQALKFGCKPIGRYIVSPVPVPPRCDRGSWKYPFPSCTQLPGLIDIEDIAYDLDEEHPCNDGYGEFPDPANCSRFFKCASGTFTLYDCPQSLRFNPVLKVCDYARTTECHTKRSKSVEELQNLTPPIHIEPDNLDKPGSHLGTGRLGELIVHPRSSFTLHCLYPDNFYGYPTWNVTYWTSGYHPYKLTTKKGTNRVSLTVTAAKEEDSGIYRCSTPFGLHNDIEIKVKAVICPALQADDNGDVFYRPTPEGELRIMGTTAEMQCAEGHKIFAQCMASGSWSKEVLSEEGCTPKKRKDESTWNCEPLDFSKDPHLIVERNDVEKIITFKCAGGKRLLGNTFVRCLDEGFWSHTSLPICKT